MERLMVKEGIDLKVLEEIGFEHCEEKGKNPENVWNGEKEDFYFEKWYEYNTGMNTIMIIESRENYKWHISQRIREVCVDLNDYDVGVSNETLIIIHKLSKLGILEEIEEDER